MKAYGLRNCRRQKRFLSTSESFASLHTDGQRLLMTLIWSLTIIVASTVVAAKNFWNSDSGFPELNEIVARIPVRNSIAAMRSVCPPLHDYLLGRLPKGVVAGRRHGYGSHF
jgi:hypothetical protein